MNSTKPPQKNRIARISDRLFNVSETDPLDFAPSIVRLQEKPPAPLGRAVLKSVMLLFLGIIIWAVFGRLDIVAVAEGKLVPQSYLKIVQPAEQGIVKEILIREGELVKKGQVLIRMDAVISNAEGMSLASEAGKYRLALRRIDSELGGKAFLREAGDSSDVFSHVFAQYQANRRAYESQLEEQRSVLDKAQQELSGAREIKTKLEMILPHYREQERSYATLLKEGHVARLDVTDKQRERIEKEQDLRSQEFVIKSTQATINQAEKKINQISADYYRQLQTERVEAAAQLEKINQELAKQQYRNELLELKAPQDGVVKDLATHTVGTVTTPGTILMTLIPQNESLRAEVWVTNEDIGFVRPGQKVKLKLSAFTFQKYGMIDGLVEHVSADSSDNGSNEKTDPLTGANGKGGGKLVYKALVTMTSQQLEVGGVHHKLTPGMQASAEIKLGTRSVMEYLFSPVTKAFHEAGRER
ncbi:MAG: HlyD family type I secretion periplasmic adaptor subunit [Pelobacteraceae bacterium]